MQIIDRINYIEYTFYNIQQRGTEGLEAILIFANNIGHRKSSENILIS